MFKKLLRLLTVFVGLIALLVIPNKANANAATQSDIPFPEVSSQASFSPVNLNVFNPSLELTNKSSNTLFDHLACNCGICTQASNRQQSL